MGAFAVPIDMLELRERFQFVIDVRRDPLGGQFGDWEWSSVIGLVSGEAKF